MDEDEVDPLDAFQEELHEAIDGLVKKYDEMMAVKWTLVMEYVTEDADRNVWLASSPGMSLWDEMGLLRYAAARRDAHASFSILASDN